MDSETDCISGDTGSCAAFEKASQIKFLIQAVSELPTNCENAWQYDRKMPFYQKPVLGYCPWYPFLALLQTR